MGRRWENSKSSHWVAICGFGFLAVAIIVTGWWLFEHQKKIIRVERQYELSAIATLKAQQIAEWRKETLIDAEMMRSNRILATQLDDWVQAGSPRDAIHDKLTTRMADLLRVYNYHAVLLLDAAAKPLLSVGEQLGLDAHNQEIALQALRTGQSLFADIYTQHQDEKSHLHLDLMVPLLVSAEGRQRAVGILVIRLEPKTAIFPLLETWPTPSETAETVLLKPTVDGVVRLSGRRHLKETVSREITLPADRMNPPNMVHERKEGFIEHLDYRNVPVLSFVRHVDGSPWYLIAKIDKAEIFAPIHSLAHQITLLVLAFIFFSGLTVFSWWRQLRATFQASRYQSELDRQMLEQRYNALSKYANDSILLVDQEGRIVEVNDRAVEIFGYSRQQLLELLISDLRTEEDKDLSAAQREQLNAEGSLLFETTFLKRDRGTFPAEVSARLIELNGQTYFQGILRDVSERKKAEQQIQFLAHHDSLTGLPNRNLLQDRLNQNLARAQRNHSKSAILFLDFDRFKNINDSLGHSVGDGVLKEVAKRLQACLRKGDTVARVGGDEFIVVLSDLDDITVAAKIAGKIGKMGTKPYHVEGQQFRLTISTGISIYPDDGEDIETLLKNADAAMYHAKNSGRDTHYFYTEDMNARTLEALNMENDLQQALVNNEFSLHYQPQIDLSSGCIIGVEALLRWQHPQLGSISPAVFIPIAEERGLIVPIGDWVLETACRQSMQWQQQGLPKINMAVNISALQMQQANFCDKLVAVLKKTGLPPEQLELELTESAIMESSDLAQVLLQQLKSLGVMLAIDDFGTGYSSLSYLKRFPIDKLKIDRSFIKDLTFDSEDEAITQAIIGIGRALKHKVIAEGVETLEQQQFLQREGCDEMQGFYFSRPLPSDDFANLLKAEQQTA